MPRIDDYINARKIAIETLSKQSLDDILKRSGFELENEKWIRVPFLDRIYRIHYPNFEFEDQTDAGKEIPIQEQILILHYMQAPDCRPSAGRWVSYREIPGASFYFSTFVKRAIDPLKNVFGQNLSGFSNAAGQLNGSAIEPGDAGFEFNILPKVPLQLILYAGDEEFPAEANILFDSTIGEILSPEDIAWLSGMLVYRLIAISNN
jgi:hypothetical protein